MKLELEPADIQAITHAITSEVVKALKPLMKGKEEDTIFTMEGLCHYLQVEPDWIYKRTGRKEIPHIKAGGLLRFRKRDIDKWLDTCQTPAVNSLSGSLKRVK